MIIVYIIFMSIEIWTIKRFLSEVGLKEIVYL